MYLRSEKKGSPTNPNEMDLVGRGETKTQVSIQLEKGKCEDCGFDFDEMGQQLSWLEHTTDNREVDGSSPFWPTTSKKVR